VDAATVLRQLEALGTAQNRKVYARHGVGGEQFGVSFGELRKLAKQIKVDDGLARALWASGNHDARVLATLVADPKQADARTLETWAADLDSYVLADAFSVYAAATPLAEAKAKTWTASSKEFVGQAGWNLVAHLAFREDGAADEVFERHLATIEREIHGRKNRVRHAMNQAVISIGIRNPALTQKALAAAKRIGKVEVDHGETGCETPDAAAYIKKTLDYRAKKAAAGGKRRPPVDLRSGR
jgi:3-methyladenine DNA glycosylase AlkD